PIDTPRLTARPPNTPLGGRNGESVDVMRKNITIAADPKKSIPLFEYKTVPWVGSNLRPAKLISITYNIFGNVMSKSSTVCPYDHQPLAACHCQNKPVPWVGSNLRPA